MARRVDSEGYLIQANGTRLPEDQQGKHEEFKKKIDDAWKKGHAGEAGPPPGTVIMLADHGDWQWKIAEQAGADPSQTAYEVNGQFKNPDLIYENDVVFLGEISKFKQIGPNLDNRDMFETQYGDRVKNPDADFKSDTTRYFSSLPEGHKAALLSAILPAGNTPGEKEATQQIFEGYLSSSANPQQELDKLKALYPGKPDESASTTANMRRETLEAAAKSLGLKY